MSSPVYSSSEAFESSLSETSSSETSSSETNYSETSSSESSLSETSLSETSSSESKLGRFGEGGYEYEFVSGPPSQEHTCLICTLVARKAQQASCCGKIFCNGCLKKWTTIKGTNCPHCRQDLEGRYFRDTRAILNINQLKVYCENKKAGCTWNGELHNAESHHDSCDHRIVPCPNQCTEVIKSMNLPQHLQMICPNREVECSHCGLKGKYHHISTDHLEQCPNLEIDCVNEGCNEKPKRKDMKTHRQECPKETVSCEYTDLGCEHVCLREALHQHSTQQVHTHLQLATKEARSARKEANRATEKANDAMQEVGTIRILMESRIADPRQHILKMTSFNMFKLYDKKWDSRPFYTFPGGYKMCLTVKARRSGAGRGTHLSVYLCLMAGKNDNKLEWPMRGEFSIELLNQERDDNHKQRLIKFSKSEAKAYNSRVDKGRARLGLGIQNFVSVKFLENKNLEDDDPEDYYGDNSLSSHRQYLKDDTLYFRVTMTKMESSSKPWLAGAIS